MGILILKEIEQKSKYIILGRESIQAGDEDPRKNTLIITNLSKAGKRNQLGIQINQWEKGQLQLRRNY